MVEKYRQNVAYWYQVFFDISALPADSLIQPETRFATLPEVLTYLGAKGFLQNPEALLILDWDKTCRQQPLSNALKFRFGEVTEEELKIIDYIQQQLCHLLVISNTIPLLYGTTTQIGKLKKYSTYPGALDEKGVAHLETPQFSLPFISEPYKSSTRVIEDTRRHVESIAPINTIAMVGDQLTDVLLANAVYRDLIQWNPHLVLQAFLLNPRPPISSDEPVDYPLGFALADR